MERGRADHKFYVPPCGLVFYVMASLGITCAFALRAGLSVAIVAMVNQTAVSQDVVTTNDSDTDQCPRDPVLQSGKGKFVWNRHEQGAVLAAYYYGEQLTQVQIRDVVFHTRVSVSRRIVIQISKSRSRSRNL